MESSQLNSGWRYSLGLLLAGSSLLLFQPVMAWQLGPIFHSSELPWQMLCVTALLGQGLGYQVGMRGSQAALVVALTSPLWGAALRAASPAALLQQHPWLQVLVAAGCALGGSLGLSQLLTRYWESRPENWRLAPFYRREIMGALASLCLALMLGPLASLMLFPWLVAGAAGLSGKRYSGLAYLSLAALTSALIPRANELAATRFYGQGHLLDQKLSPYQFVEVVEWGEQPYLFLNGMCHYGPLSVNQLNRYLAEWPASRLSLRARQAGCIVLGAGSFVAPAFTRRAGLSTTVIELDRQVARAGALYFESQTRIIHPARDWTLVIGDARQEIKKRPATGLIVVNLPSPYSLNVASLFTREFFETARGRLVDEGQLSLFLGAPLEEGTNPVQGPVIRALLEVFPHLLAISSSTCDNTVLLASQAPLGEPEEWRKFLREQGQAKFQIYRRDDLVAMTCEVAPASLNDLRFCARLNHQLWQAP